MTAEVEQQEVAERSASAEERKMLWPPLIIAVVALWILPLATSLGLDETGVWWVVKDGLSQVIPRANLWQQSILHSLLVWAARWIGGDSDVAMRMPSAVAMCGALYLLWKLGSRLINPLSAMFACLVFVTMTDVVYVASTVRPYALGLLLVNGAMLALINWLDSGRLRYAVVYVAAAALAMYSHYFFGVMFVVHAAYAINRWRSGNSLAGLGALLTAWFVAGLLILPLVPLAIGLNASRTTHVYLPTPGIDALLSSVTPTIFVGSVALSCIVWAILQRPISIGNVWPRTSGTLLAFWALAPIAIFFIISVLTEKKVFAPRYYIASAPALALICGALLGAMKPARFRLLATTLIVALSVVIFDVNGATLRGAVDYRSAVHAINEHIGAAQTPVVAVPSFYESRTVEAVLDPTLSDVLFAPFLRYRIGGKLIRVPGDLTSETEPYLEEVMKTSLASQREFFVVGLMLSERYQGWLAGRCASLGFKSRTYGNYGGVEVVLFERRDR